MKVLLVLLLLAIPAAAHADQCAVIDDAVANRAVAVLRGHRTVIEYCEPCQDAAPGAPRRIDQTARSGSAAGRVVKTHAGGADYGVAIDGRAIDLAYTYVQTAPSKYENLAVLAGCPASDVSASLVASDASDTGVMITAGSAPSPRVEHQVTEAPAPMLTYVVHTEDHFGLVAALAACVASSGLWALAMMRLLRRRRTVAMRPRALDLIDRPSMPRERLTASRVDPTSETQRHA